MRRLFAALVAIALVAIGLPVMARQADAPQANATQKSRAQALLKFQHDLVSVLALRAEARPLMGAALLARPLQDPGKGLSYHRLIQRALNAGDAGPATQWAALADCDAKAGNCPNAAALKALEGDDADNAAVWMLATGVHARDGDRKGMRAMLHRAAQASRYDDYTGRSLQALADAVMTLPVPKSVLANGQPRAGAQVMIVYGLGQTQPLPGFSMIAQLCESDQDRAKVKDDCLQLGHILEWGSHPLARSLGLHLVATLSDKPDTGSEAATQRRDLVWQVQQFGKLSARAANDAKVANKLLALARHGGTQMSVMLAALHAFDIPQNAPADWKEPDQPRATPSHS
ncbi:hypothetical protein [Oleiagrimonas sp. C23AA]|uniref:hypothetical protein n=1 Tax=Oleiagrimonas sp. C23AA TaxID=2719047 RepID=UPI00141D87E9|nr:hypothetical protein [Oleiagrimonas sp. C23AA]NII10602.1 hypothetical protein [Oleiagrimonas sp. C23AA]